MEKLQVAFELKSKSKESDKYLKEILMSNGDMEDPELTPYNTSAPYYEHGDQDDLLEESLLQPIGDDDEGSDGSEFSPKGRRCGEYTCGFCRKTFKYQKAYKRHMNQHNNGDITGGGYKRRYQLKKKQIVAPVLPEQTQAPYDSRSPYGSPAHFASPARDSSPDFGAMITSRFLNGSNGAEVPIEQPNKRLRLLKQKSPSRSASREISPLVELTPVEPPSSRSRGRPRKQTMPGEAMNNDPAPLPGPSRSRGRPRKQTLKNIESDDDGDDETSFNEVDVDSMLKYDESTSQPGPSRERGRGRPRKYPRTEDNDDDDDDGGGSSLLASFSEVDVSSMLKSKNLNFTIDDAVSHSAPSTSHSRSRSSSVELVQEFDIFGAVVPFNRGPKAPPVKSGFGSGTTFGCVMRGCSKKFHLRANLKKHMREAHGQK